MIFNNVNLRSFLEDKPFYESDNCFCLGNTLSEAGKIVREIVDTAEGETDNVELDI